MKWLSLFIVAAALVVPNMSHAENSDQAIEIALKKFQEAKDYGARDGALKELDPLVKGHPNEKVEATLWNFCEASFEFDVQQFAMRTLNSMLGLKDFQEKLEARTAAAVQASQSQEARLKAIALLKWAGYITYDFRFEGTVLGDPSDEVALMFDATPDRISKEIELRLRGRLLSLLNDKDNVIRLRASQSFDRYFNKNVASEISKLLDDSDDVIFDVKVSAIYSAIKNYWLNPHQIQAYIPRISISERSAVRVGEMLRKELASEKQNEMAIERPLMVLAAAGESARPAEAELMRALQKIGQGSWGLRAVVAEALGNLKNSDALTIFLKEYESIESQIASGDAPDSIRLYLTQLARFESDRVVDSVLPLVQSPNPGLVFYGYLTLNYRNARNPKYLAALDQVRFRISSDISSSDENKRNAAVSLEGMLGGSDLERIGKSIAYNSLIDPKRSIADRLKNPGLISSVGSKGALNVFIALTAKVFVDEKTLIDSDNYKNIIKSFPLEDLEKNEIWFYSNVLTPALSSPEGRALAENYFNLMIQKPASPLRSWWYPSIQTLADVTDQALASNSPAVVTFAEYLIIYKFDQGLTGMVLKPKLDDSEASTRLKRAIENLKARYKLVVRGPWGEELER